MQSPVLVLKDSLTRETGSKVHHANIQASKAVADIIRTTLGPRSMLKMLLDAQGGIVVTNDGNAILRELDLAHPAAKSMIELSRTQDEEVGDGTTSVIVLAGEMLHVAEAFIDKSYHPTVICRAYNKALEDALAVLEKISVSIDVNDRTAMLGLVKSCIGTKFTSQFGDLIADLALDATTTIGVDLGQGLREVDIKKYIKVEKVPGGQLEDSKVLKGVMINKDVVVPGKMRRKIVNPRIILLDSPIEYKKGENQTNAELVKEEDWSVLLKMEEEYIENLCVQILKFKPDLVITEKGLSDLACHYFSKAGVSAIRRLRKTDNNRIAKACGAVIVNRADELQESDVGTGAGLFEVKKIGDEFFAYIVECKDPKACTVLLRGASKDLLNEVERNLQDAMSVARNIIKNPKLVPGGGATELTVSATLKQKSSSVEGIEKWPYEAAAVAFEAIPRTLAQNCGVNVIRTMTALQGKHANGENAWVGIDGNTGAIADMKESKIWDAFNVKAQTFKTAIEAACMLLRIDDIVSGIKKKQAPGAGGPSKPTIEQEGDFVLVVVCSSVLTMMDEFQPLKTSMLFVTRFHKDDVTDEEVYNHFKSSYPDGHIVSCKIGWGGSKNLQAAFVDYASHEQAKIAIKLLDSTKLKDYTIRVRFSFRHQNTKLSIIYLKNFDKSIDKDYLHNLLSPYGKLLVIQLHTDTDSSGQSSGAAAVQYDSVEAAQTAIKGLNGRLIMNKKLHVSSSNYEPDDEDGNTIFLSLLDSYLPKRYFWQTLGRFGPISSVRLIEKFPKGDFFAEVVFKYPADAAKAADALKYGFDPKLACLKRYRDQSEEESTKKEAPGAPEYSKAIALLEFERNKAVSQIYGKYSKLIRHIKHVEVEQKKAMYRWNRNSGGYFPAPKKIKLDKAIDVGRGMDVLESFTA